MKLEYIQMDDVDRLENITKFKFNNFHFVYITLHDLYITISIDCNIDSFYLYMHFLLSISLSLSLCLLFISQSIFRLTFSF